jgi:16S rRNA processing protein RimM
MTPSRSTFATTLAAATAALVPSARGRHSILGPSLRLPSASPHPASGSSSLMARANARRFASPTPRSSIHQAGNATTEQAAARPRISASSRSRAGALRGEEVLLDRAELDPPEEDEFYVADLIGMSAVDASGVEIGAVAETFETPAHEVLVVRSDSGGRTQERYVPFTAEHVPEVDLRSGRLVVRFPEE